MSEFFLWAIVLVSTLAISTVYWIGNRERGDGDSGDQSSDIPLIRKLKLSKLPTYAFLTAVYVILSFAIFQEGILQPWLFGLPILAYLAIADFFGNWLCFSFGWGKFFPHGRNYSTVDNSPMWKQKEFLPAEWVANLVVGKWVGEKPVGWVKNWQTVAMSARFLLTFSLVKFSLLGAILSFWWYPLLTLPFMATVGLVYRYHFASFTPLSVMKSEYTVGIVLGAAHALPWILYASGVIAM